MKFNRKLLGTKERITAMTHSGVFHVDDVFCTAFLQILHHGPMDIKRVETVPEKLTSSTIVYDIGYGEFDHHQMDSKTRSDGLKYSAFGLLWNEFGYIVVQDDEERKFFDESFVRSIDATDNKGDWSPLACLFGSFNPLWDAPESQLSKEAKDMSSISHFMIAVETAKKLLQAKFGAMNANVRARKYVQNLIDMRKRLCLKDDQILVLDRYVPYELVASKNGYKFAIFPSNRGGYSASTIRDNITNKAKIRFPEEWNTNPESRPYGITFVHAAGFMITGKTLDNVYQACRKLLNIN